MYNTCFRTIKALFDSLVYLLKDIIRLQRIEFKVIVIQCQFLVVSSRYSYLTVLDDYQKLLNNNVLISCYLNFICFLSRAMKSLQFAN
jgi:hypothetical protein